MSSYRYQSRARHRNSRDSRTIGHERALEHIEEARRLSEELGGTDRDVKDYFFGLPHHDLQIILNEYEQRYGSDARNYAEATLAKWRSGRVHMSGLVASRLFNLLPQKMPLHAKYKLTEGLWRHLGPSSKKRLRVGFETEPRDVIPAISQHIDDVVINYQIPENLVRRFEWLSGGDIHVKQLLLNHIRQMEKTLVIEGARAQLPLMLNHLRSDAGNYTRRLAQVLKIGKHELEVLIDKHAIGVSLEDTVVYVPETVKFENNVGWIWWVAGSIILLLIFSNM